MQKNICGYRSDWDQESGLFGAAIPWWYLFWLTSTTMRRVHRSWRGDYNGEDLER